MKRKSLVTVTLTLMLCLSFALASFALPNAKELVLDQVKGLTLNVDPGYYEKAESTGYLEIKKFDGKVKDEIGDLKGLKVDLTAQVDTPANAMKMNFATNVAGKPHQADIYFANDKMIFTKDLLNIIKGIGAQLDDMEGLGDLDALPTYLYLQDNQLKNIWQQMAVYQKQQYPEEIKDLLVFAVEAIPSKCFTVNNSKVTVKLNQKDFEETVYNLAAKVKEEPERFADIIVALNAYNTTGAGNPEEMKAEIIAGLEEMTLPTKSDLAEMGKYVDVNMVMESSLVPGGKKSFDFTVDLKAKEFVTGKIVFKTDFTGKDTNMKGNSLFTADIDVNEGPKVNFELKSDFDYQGPKGKSNMTINVKAQDNATKELYCDISLYGATTDVVKPDLTIQAPQLTEENSVDLATLMPKVEIPKYVDVMVNGEYLESDVWPYIKDGRTMVPIRAVAEALECTVEWVEPNEVRITSGDNVIKMYIDQTNYQVNGVEKQLDVTPFIEDGSTMVPVRFIAEALGATVELDDAGVQIKK